jgi:hypothetical protein
LVITVVALGAAEVAGAVVGEEKTPGRYGRRIRSASTNKPTVNKDDRILPSTVEIARFIIAIPSS